MPKLYNNSAVKDTDLTPVIITYNRAEKLAKTLEAFYHSALKHLTFYVLDNASTDSTPEVVAEFQKKWPTLCYVRHSYNIGGNGNILRAVEYGTGNYLWIIGDDDDWKLENLLHCELFNVIISKKADLIRLGWLVFQSQGRYEPIKSLIKTESQVFVSLSQLSSTIYRRQLLIDTLPYCYFNAGDFYPHLVPVLKMMATGDPVVYSVSYPLVNYIPGGETNSYFCGDLKWFVGWFRTSRFIEHSPNLQYHFNDEVLCYLSGSQSRWRHFWYMFRSALKFESLGVPQRTMLMSMIPYAPKMRSGLFVIFLLLSCMPRFLLKKMKHHFEKQGKGLVMNDQVRV